MTTTPFAKRTWGWIAAGLLAVVGVSAVAYVAYHGNSGSVRHVHAAKGGDSTPGSSAPHAPSDRQLEALKLTYPASTGKLPPTISSTYNAHKDKTRMALELRKLE